MSDEPTEASVDQLHAAHVKMTELLNSLELTPGQTAQILAWSVAQTIAAFPRGGRVAGLALFVEALDVAMPVAVAELTRRRS